MDRRARAYFKVIRIDRWSLALLLLVALALLLFPTRGFLPVISVPRADSDVVRQGVTMLNRDFSGKTESQVRDMLAEMTGLLNRQPVPAQETILDGISYVVPELNGTTLDVDATWFRLRIAEEGAQVDPAARIHAPPRRLADFPASVIRHGNDHKAAVALLVNVDWGEKELPSMLAAMKRRGIHVTFFVSGGWAERFPTLLKQMAEDGHEIATHGHSLATGPKELARAGKLKADIARSVVTIQGITGRTVRYYAPHMSEISPEILTAAADLKLRTVLYSLDTVDWKPGVTGEAILATLGKAKAGDLVLLHPKPNTARILEQGMLSLQNRGLEPTTLTDVLSPDPGTPPEAWHGSHE